MDNGLNRFKTNDIHPSNLGTRWIETIAAWSGRVIVLIALVYSMWRYGAVEAIAMRDLSILLVTASGFAGVKQLAQRRVSPTSTVLILIAIGWIGYAYLQTLPTPSWFSEMIQWSHPAYAAENLESLAQAATQFGSTPVAPKPDPTASIIPRETRQSLVPFLLATITLITSALLFDSRRSRSIYLWTLVINAAALCIWGIVQRTGGNQDILPGVTYDVDGAPFASFIYKNAGAAAVLPALAMIAALAIHRKDCDPDDQFGGPPFERVDLFSTRFLTLASLAILVLVGLGTSLSRGSWAAGTIAALGVLIVRGRFKPNRTHLVGCVVGFAAVAIVIAISGVFGDVWKRAEEVSTDRIANDPRVDQRRRRMASGNCKPAVRKRSGHLWVRDPNAPRTDAYDVVSKRPQPVPRNIYGNGTCGNHDGRDRDSRCRFRFGPNASKWKPKTSPDVGNDWTVHTAVLCHSKCV